MSKRVAENYHLFIPGWQQFLIGNSLSIIAEEDNMSEVNYLDREERIISMARERVRRLEKDFGYNELEDKLLSRVPFDEIASQNTILEELEKSFRLLVKNSENWDLLSQLVSIDGWYNISIEKMSNIFVRGVDRKKEQIKFKITDRFGSSFEYMSLIGKMSNKQFVFYLIHSINELEHGTMRNKHNLMGGVDAGTFLTRWYCFKNSVKNYNRDIEKEEIKTYLIDSFSPKVNNIYDIKNALYVPKREDETSYLIPFLEELGIKAEFMDKESFNLWYREQRKLKRNEMPNELERPVLSFDSFSPLDNGYSMFYKAKGEFPVSLLLKEWNDSKMFMPLPRSYCYDSLREYVLPILKEKADRNRIIREIKSSSTSYAKSFQTKKNIPDKVLEEMKKSNLNNFFGYVEFDELTDLAKAKEVAKEIEAFIGEYIPNINEHTQKNALRFRRLGNHKASGLYYPGVFCLCVDIHSPSSFIHELGHLIDNIDNSSIKPEFYEIRSLYTELVKKATKENNVEMKGKYDLSYYLQPTEIFARCFEMYACKELKVKNSLVRENCNQVYPSNNENFMKSVTDYFNTLLRKYKKTEDNKNGREEYYDQPASATA